ncbi:rod shape-determining protein MreD [Novosphingobium sp. ZN18A2]|uniref:rod shape-determining protein MreD n=1 Tax=Novosphingobium sp. ZN18A2 TaxID=3079861 RepID=UPI0030D1E9B9
MATPRIVARTDNRRAPNQINRDTSPILAIGVPWASILLASMASLSPVIASAPIMPPLGFMLLITWRMMRPGLLPVWAGLPLGAFDDLYSGQPMGSAVVLWSLAMLAMEFVDERYLWRGFFQDWLAAAGLFAGYLLLGAVIAGIASGYILPFAVLPQLVLTIALYPAVSGLVALLDRFRLTRFRTL